MGEIILKFVRLNNYLGSLWLSTESFLLAEESLIGIHAQLKSNRIFNNKNKICFFS